jgi:biotin-dependent carboxylase-like uncharacterized protein
MIEVLNPGTYASIQDVGRQGYRRFGVPCSGFMDKTSAEITNALLGKDINSPLFEMAQSGCKLRFHKSTALVLGGAEVVAQLNGLPVKTNKLISVQAGDLFEIKACLKGVWSYLGILGTLKVERQLHSYSQFMGITTSSKLRKGDMIDFIQTASPPNPNSRLVATVFNREQLDIPIYKGPEFHLLTPSSRRLLFNTKFHISHDSNRMAYTFKEHLASHTHSIITCPVLPGTVQWTPSGKLFCLMRDAQTTGGYPRILLLPESSITLLSQKSIGQRFGWVLSTLE